MDSQFFFGVSLTGSFLAGMLALFAPCCISFLFPAYLGTIFKKAQHVVGYTVIFSLGLATILLPVALGFRLIVSTFDMFHQQLYYVGALLLVAMGIMTLFEIKMPFSFHVNAQTKKNVNAFGVYTLGIFSGLASSCCAPVLFAAATLTSLAPTLLQATLVASAYVLGIVFPLFILSLLYEKVSTATVGTFRKKTYTVFKIIGGFIFIGSGIVIAILNAQGKIVMGGAEGMTTSLRLFIFNIARYISNSFVDVGIFIIILFIFYILLKKGINKKNKILKDSPCCHDNKSA